MRSYLLSEFVKALHLRKDAPMPSELKAAHAKVNRVRACADVPQGARILKFERTRGAR